MTCCNDPRLLFTVVRIYLYGSQNPMALAWKMNRTQFYIRHLSTCPLASPSDPWCEWNLKWSSRFGVLCALRCISPQIWLPVAFLQLGAQSVSEKTLPAAALILHMELLLQNYITAWRSVCRDVTNKAGVYILRLFLLNVFQVHKNRVKPSIRRKHEKNDSLAKVNDLLDTAIIQDHSSEVLFMKTTEWV